MAKPGQNSSTEQLQISALQTWENISSKNEKGAGEIEGKYVGEGGARFR